ncbi:hypothetical protein [uncultured Deefgea sp.]|uniref:hypothetical protein n=1 Tax=uncultured Deefgea sp. TaxID=1304914 RepID=UPI002623A6ED|nr:hypothetical protein [uncultured Deefgea sp.]
MSLAAILDGLSKVTRELLFICCLCASYLYQSIRSWLGIDALDVVRNACWVGLVLIRCSIAVSGEINHETSTLKYA